MTTVLLTWFFLQFHISSDILNSFTHTKVLQESTLTDWSIYSHAMLNYYPLQLHEALQHWLHAKCLNVWKQTQLAMNQGAHTELEVSVTIYAYKTKMTHLQYEDRWSCKEHSLCTRLYWKDYSSRDIVHVARGQQMLFLNFLFHCQTPWWEWIK